MPLQEKIFWQTTLTMPEPTEQTFPEQVDVAVIGAGFTGLAAARALAKRDVSVAVLEAETIGWGASSRNGGMVLPGLKLGVSTLTSKYGEEVALRMHEESVQSIDCVEQIVTEEAIECDFTRTGHLSLASKPQHFAGFQRSAELLGKRFHHPVRLLGKDELGSEIGSNIYHGGIVDECSAGLNPARYVAGLARAAERAGARLFANTPVERVAPRAAGSKFWTLQTSRGPLQAGAVFVATSGYTGTATPALRRKIVPIGSFVIVTERLSSALALELIPKKRMVYDSKHYLHYYRLTPDGRMLFGGRAAFFPENQNTVRSSAEILRVGMIQVFPQLRNAAVEYAWGGTLDVTFDVMPHCGELNGIHFAVGYAGHGVALATFLGTRMADAILGGKQDQTFASIPFPGAPLGLYNGRPWFLPFAGAWYKLLDWVS